MSISRILIAVSAISLSLPVFAANCTKNPSHPSCSSSGPSVSNGSLPNVYNGTGDEKRLLGRAYAMVFSRVTYNDGYADPTMEVRLVENVSGVDHGYALRFGEAHIERADSNLSGNAVYLDSACSGSIAAVYLGGRDYLPPVFAPFQSREVRVLWDTGSPDKPRLSLVRVSGNRIYTPFSQPVYRFESGSCRNWTTYPSMLFSVAWSRSIDDDFTGPFLFEYE